MENQQIFVFRIAKGNEPGNPVGKCPLDYSDVKRKISKIKRHEINQIDYENNGYKDFIFNELWNNYILRQGWGIKNLDLNQDNKSWIKNYMISGKIYWDRNIECSHAKGRLNILRRMRHIGKNDVILIPKTSSRNINDYNRFVACQVEQTYFFKYPPVYRDFGHCIKVKNIKEFEYGKLNLDRNDFGSPYLWAITEVKKHHHRYNKFRQFALNNYKIKI